MQDQIDFNGNYFSSTWKHLDLFSGIGGFALACRMVGGIETVGFCEIDPWAQKVLRKNFPNIPIHDDVKTLETKNYGAIDLITGGYPCQPFSLAGQRKGEDDDRHLWPEVRRIIQQARPRWVLCENVAGHITMGLDEVLSDLASENYSAEAIIIPACAVGAGHRRDRVWLIANANYIRRERRECGMREMRQWGYSQKSTIHLFPFGDWGRNNLPKSAICRTTDGIPNRVDRLKGLGNAIVPQVAAEIIRAMKQAQQ